jgi:hypothetical protein
MPFKSKREPMTDAQKKADLLFSSSPKVSEKADEESDDYAPK